MTTENIRIPTHPGVIFAEEFQKVYNFSLSDLAVMLLITERQMNAFLVGDFDLCPESYRALADITATSYKFWFNLHEQYRQGLINSLQDEYVRVADFVYGLAEHVRAEQASKKDSGEVDTE